MAPTITDVTAANRDRVEAFLDEHAATTLFLAANLSRFGPRLTEAINSGNFKCLEDDGRIRGVFCLTRRGNLLADTGGRAEFAQAVLDACSGEPCPIRGVVGEWRLASALWRILLTSGRITEQFASREKLYRLDLRPTADPREPGRAVRRLSPDDFERWSPLNLAYLAELNLPLQVAEAQRQAEFAHTAAAGHWWGLFDDRQLLAIGGLNAVHGETAQIGGVYTVPERRRRGLGRALMRALLADAAAVHGLKKLILFTGETDIPAQRLYESLDFTQIGEFGLLFGMPTEASAE